jgi:GxxExxY protein
MRSEPRPRALSYIGSRHTPETQPAGGGADERGMEQEGGKAGRFDDCSQTVIGACIEVHRHLGPGLLESAYEQCLCHELSQLGVAFERQRWLPIRYKGIELHRGYRLDLVVGEHILVEIKAVAQLLPVHEAQVISYLKLSGLPTGLLINFHTTAIKQGLRRLTNKKDLPAFPPSCKPENR